MTSPSPYPPPGSDSRDADDIESEASKLAHQNRLAERDKNKKSPEEACKDINAETERIKADVAKTKQIACAIGGFFNPQCWGNNNEAKAQISNITSVDMSDNDVIAINSKCSQVSTTVQSNSINTKDCEYCQKKGCTLKNVRMTNRADQTNKCSINAFIDLVATKEASIKNLAAIGAAQTAEGIRNDNKVDANVCNYNFKDMSSNQYLEQRQKCIQDAYLTQENELNQCGDVIDLIMENNYSKYNECMLDATLSKETDAKTSSESDSSFSFDQISKLINPWVSLGSCVFCAIAIVAIVLISMRGKKKSNGS